MLRGPARTETWWLKMAMVLKAVVVTMARRAEGSISLDLGLRCLGWIRCYQLIDA